MNLTRKDILTGIAAISVPFISLSEIRKGSIAAFSILRSDCKDGISAKSYVQDGLILILDGIENVEWGQHDETAVKWKNLINGEEYAIGNRMFKENGLEWINTSTLTIVPPCILGEDFFLSDKTIEFVGDSAATTYNNVGLRGQSSFGFYQNMYGSSPNRYYNTNIYAYNIGSWPFFQWQYEHDGVFENEHHRSALVMQNSYVQPYYEGNTKLYNRKATIPSYTTGFTSFIWAGRIGCRCHCIRIYNRALSAKEVMHNYNIDKVRFGL